MSDSASSAKIWYFAASLTSVQLLARNPDRKMALFSNNTTATLYIKFGTQADPTDFTVIIPGNSYYEMPLPIYTGEIHGIFSALVSGTLFITEM